jgi:hypothetical protein
VISESEPVDAINIARNKYSISPKKEKETRNRRRN